MDFTPMYAAHDAFRRDLDRLLAAARAGLSADPSVRAGWRTFREQLDIHHRAEDDALWPLMRERLADRPDDMAVLDAMAAEHGRIDPMVETIDSLLDEHARLYEHAEGLSAALAAHLEHEEEDALPMIAPGEWAAFTALIRKRQGLRGAAVFVPWVLDGTPAESQREFLGLLPPPARFLYRRRWLPAYHRTARWSALPA